MHIDCVLITSLDCYLYKACCAVLGSQLSCKPALLRSLRLGWSRGEELFRFFTPSLLLSSQTLATKIGLLWIKQIWIMSVLKTI